MNRLFTLLLAASCLTAVGQVTYPYNPDGNADGDIAVGDLQDFLTVYGNPFSPSEIMVGDSSLTYWVEHLWETVQGQQELIDSITNESQTTAPTGNFGHFYQSFNFPQGRGGESLILYLEGEEEFQVPQGYNFYVYMTKDFGCSNEGIADFYGGYIDGVQMHSTTPNGFSYLGYASGTTIKQVGCSSYVLYGFLMPAVEWVNYELVSLGPGDSMTIPEGKHFFANSFEGDNSQLSFSVTPEPPGLLYSEIDFPYSTGSSHLWSGIVTNNSLGDCTIYGYTFDSALYGSLSSTSQGNDDSIESNSATIQWESTVEDSVHILSGNINTLRVVQPSASLDSWWLHASPPINGSYVHYLNFSEIEDFVNSNGITNVNWLGPAWRGVMELDLSQLNSSSLEVEFDKICDERAQYSDAVLSLTSLGFEYSFSGQDINVVLYDGETRLADMTGPYKNWEFLYSPTATPPTVNDELQEGYTGTAIMKFQRLESGQWVREY